MDHLPAQLVQLLAPLPALHPQRP